MVKTDKTGRLAVVHPDIYKKMGIEHLRQDRDLSQEDITEVQKTVSAHTSSWVKIMVWVVPWSKRAGSEKYV